MKATFHFLLLSAMLISCGCMTPSEVPYLLKDYQVGKTTECSVGNPIFVWGAGLRPRNTEGIDTAMVFRSGRIVNPQGIIKQLIYKGVIEEKIYCIYREYLTSDITVPSSIIGISRPLGTGFPPYEVIYDLKQGKTVAFQGFKIRVESADQQKLVFTILEESKSMDEGLFRWEARQYLKRMSTSK